MRVLLDEQLDWRLGRSFGEGFDALVTIDKGIPHQQNLSRHSVAVVSLDARSARLDDTAPIVEGNLERIRLAPPGKATRLP